ncbi:4380_t:CDS:2, partial [Racocetra persica]
NLGKKDDKPRIRRKDIEKYMADNLAAIEETFYNQSDDTNAEYYKNFLTLDGSKAVKDLVKDIREKFKNVIDNNYLLPEYMTGNGVDATRYFINEIERLKRIIVQHQKKEQEYERELNKILEE